MINETIPTTTAQLDGFTPDEWASLEDFMKEHAVASVAGDVALSAEVAIDSTVEEDLPEQISYTTLSSLADEIRSLDDEKVVGDTLACLRDALDYIGLAENETDLAEVQKYLTGVVMNVKAQKIAEESATIAKQKAQDALDKARQHKLEKSQDIKTTKISQDDIAWIRGESEVTVTRHSSKDGKVFWLGRTTELSNITEVDQGFITSNAYTEVEEIMINHIGEKMDSTDRRQGSLRPLIRRDNTRRLTRFNGYSDDQVNPSGFRNGDIRVLLLENTRTDDGEPIYYIASVCRHDEDQQRIYNIQ